MHELCDVWRRLNGMQKQYTWTHVRDRIISMARLDRFYIFKHHYNIIRNCHIVPVSFSDHCMVKCSVFINLLKPKSAYWQFNTALLSDTHFKECFNYFWEDFKTKKGLYNSVQQWFTRNITKETNFRMSILEADILKLQDLAENTGTRGFLDLLLDKKTQLADLLGSRTQGALVRSRFQNMNQMDASTKFFFNLEKKNGQSRTIHGLRSESGILLTDPSDIRQRAVGFYKDLYKSEVATELENEGEFFFENLPQVPESINSGISGPLSMSELQKAFQGMVSGKAPGIDGIPVDFYKSFWSPIGDDLLEVLNTSLARGKLPQSCRRAVLTLLPKKGDLGDIKCWRPVSLLCSDYKLLSKVLTNRLANVMDNVIHPDQTYCVPGRSIFDNIYFIRDLIEVTKMLNLNCGFISLDQEKAFDRIEHCFLWKVLNAFGFSESFINYIKVLYNGVESILKVNGGLCTPFTVFRGIRQGCALSGMLYSLAIEPLLNQIRCKLQGVILPKCKNKFILSAYADDVTVCINGQSDIQALLNLLKTFKKISSANINWGKSEAFLIGDWKNAKPKLPMGLQWGKIGFKYLGVFIGDEVMTQKNWEGIIDKVKGRLDKWKWLLPKMSFRGRVLIANNLVASSLWHKFACLDPPITLMTKLKALLVDFFWDKLHWVPQSILFLSKEAGGQGLIHLQSRIAAFRLQFVQRLLTVSDVFNWNAVARLILDRLGNFNLGRTIF